MFEQGYWRIGRIRGVPVRFHWTVPVGAFLFGRFEFVPAFWLAFILIVLVHELGHAAMVWRYRHRVMSIDVTGFGGLCRWSGQPSRFERAAIAWGGVLAQALLLVVALILLLTGVWTVVPGGGQLAGALIHTNLMIMVLNLVPLPPLDGAEAWRILGMVPDLFTRHRARRHGRALWQQVLQQPVPKRRVVRRRPSAPPEPGAPESGPRPAPPGGAGPVQRELADLLRDIGTEAGRARRGGDQN